MLYFKPDDITFLSAILKSDSEFLNQCKFMDYSVLLAIEY